MSDSDYNLALLLQRQFEHENRKEDHSSDQRLALLLQQQFQQEDNIENPNQSLTYSKTNNKSNNSKSLVDPSWELIDPTPNIHALFIAFNQQFFWNKLQAVCVSWSKRMTTCAGVCSYQGRAGLCSITLSEPLLKLRPRKDLVETLLHEMIHAYLFVTHNNKDRDGHGPEFHKHMYRINSEAGTSITVYHDFHDEVKLYKTHWWRCDGPCQHRKPFYGMVRRATNRAPGKYDRWWDEHSRTCGGTFIKVKEPEKVNKVKNEKSGIENKPNPKMDIRNYFGNTTNSPNNDPKINNIHNIHKTASPKVSTKAHVFNDNSKIKNINGFHNLPNTNNVKGGTKLNGETIVITKTNKPATVTTNEIPKSPAVFTGSGNVLSSNQSTNDYNAVRNHWINKFDNKSNTASNNKRRSNNAIHTPQKKIKTTAQCPICSLSFDQYELDKHIDECLENNLKLCPTCNNSIYKNKYEEHIKNCGKVQCEICDEFVPTKTLPDHMQSCLQNVSFAIGNNSFEHKKCPVCESDVQEDIYEKHLESCMRIQKMFDEVEETLEKQFVQCSICKKKLRKEDLNKHMDNCKVINLNTERDNYELFDNEEEMASFINDTSLIDEYNNTNNSSVILLENDTGNNGNSDVILLEDDTIACPVCDERVLNSTINSHLDICLGI